MRLQPNRNKLQKSLQRTERLWKKKEQRRHWLPRRVKCFRAKEISGKTQTARGPLRATRWLRKAK